VPMPWMPCTSKKRRTTWKLEWNPNRPNNAEKGEEAEGDRSRWRCAGIIYICVLQQSW